MKDIETLEEIEVLEDNKNIKKRNKNHKFKKWIWILLILMIFLGISAVAFVKISKEYQYRKTYEYKLMNIGYSKNEANLIEKTFTNSELITILNNAKDNTLLTVITDEKFIKENYSKYLTYLDKNTNTDISKVINMVNLGLDNEFYENAKEADPHDGNLILVNKFHHLNKDYIPEDLVDIPLTYAWGNNQTCKKEVYDAFLKMWKDAKEADFYLMINLCYRSFLDQEDIYNQYLSSHNKAYADKVAARSGYSEHQTGLALDILEKNNANLKTFDNSAVANWLKENAHKYGFILRYPEDKEDITGFSYEPWHYRFVGTDIAKTIYENNLTYEEYYFYNIK